MDETDRMIIDCHTHLVSIADIDGFLEYVDAAGLSAISVMAMVNPKPAW